MTKKKMDQLLDILDLDLIVNVHHGDQQILEVPKTILIQLSKKIDINDVSHDKKNIIIKIHVLMRTCTCPCTS